MRALGFLPLVVLVLLVVLVVRSRRPTRPGEGSRAPGEPAPAEPATEEPATEEPATEEPAPGKPEGEGSLAPLASDVARWVAAGLLSAEQARGILAHEAAGEPEAAGGTGVDHRPPRSARQRAPRRRGTPSVAEGLGYLGGVLAGVGLVLLVARYWADIATPGRLALSGAGALGFLGAGALVREQAAPALARLRWFLWLASTAMTAVLVRVLCVDGLDVDRAVTVVLACAGAVTLESGVLWWRRERPLQQLTFLAGAATTLGAAVGEVVAGGWAGLAVWAAGATYVALGLRRAPPLPTLTVAAGALSAFAGSIVVANPWLGTGFVLAAATALALVALATVRAVPTVRADQLVLGILGALGLLEAVPSLLVYFGRDAGGATGLVTWALGGVLVVVGARRLVRLPQAVQVAGCAALVGGAAITGNEWHGFAPLFGVANGIALIALGMRPRLMLLSVAGSVALLVNVPWAIVHFFPGEGRAPLLIFVSGALIVAVAVLLSVRGGWFHRDAHSGRDRGAPPAPPPAPPAVTRSGRARPSRPPAPRRSAPGAGRPAGSPRG